MTPEPELLLQGGAAIREQIQDQVRACIMLGLLRPGEQLPTVRSMAVELGVNPNAVEQAYEQLQREGFVTTEDGSGTFATLPPQGGLPRAGRRAQLETLCLDFLARTAGWGFSPVEVLQTLHTLAPRSSLSWHQE
jgi:GntR family transcriptional regulator